ncbi:hypothetical protein CDCA_CDCA07G2278 [Cyanidium caldarium]|uniref:mRNA-decapping enzyme-like protein n=1 Tax=Cyanidium caldarium TaxID=2771 RepID=A0AAV9IWR8_CYACA|nr:hypothetical protein CDCA_CDCA07G2278 [Cyanidium caldarium]
MPAKEGKAVERKGRQARSKGGAARAGAGAPRGPETPPPLVATRPVGSDGHDVNLAVLRRLVDASVDEILFTAPHVVVYDYDPQGLGWRRAAVEGALFLVRFRDRSCALVVHNRKSPENLVDRLAPGQTVETTDEFLMYQTAVSPPPARAVWFHGGRAERDACGGVVREVVAVLLPDRLGWSGGFGGGHDAGVSGMYGAPAPWMPNTTAAPLDRSRREGATDPQRPSQPPSVTQFFHRIAAAPLRPPDAPPPQPLWTSTAPTGNPAGAPSSGGDSVPEFTVYHATDVEAPHRPPTDGSVALGTGSAVVDAARAGILAAAAQCAHRATREALRAELSALLNDPEAFERAYLVYKRRSG